MSSQGASQVSRQGLASHHYLIVSLGALAVILLVLLYWGVGRWSFLPVLIGALGVIARWRLTDSSRPVLDRRIARLMSPLLTLTLLAGLLIASGAIDLPPRRPAPGFSLPDWLLSGAVLALCLAQYRVLAMTVSIFPDQAAARGAISEPRAQRTLTQPRKPQLYHRNPELITATEISWLLLSLPIWAFLAQLCWRLVPAGVTPDGFAFQAWHGIVLLWLVVISGLLLAGLRSYTGLRRLHEREARLLLQDVFWNETGPEQRRLNRWLAWADLRRRRKEK
jgi:hypothetical protein